MTATSTPSSDPSVGAEVSGAAPREVPCTHCGLPVPAGLIEPGGGEQFCCAACRTARRIIMGAGLEHYYALARSSYQPGAPARGIGGRFAEFDDPSFAELYCRPCGTGSRLRSAQFMVEGLHCAACVWLLEKLPTIVPGVRDARVQFRQSLLTVTFDPGEVRLSSVAQTVDSLGYAPHPAKERSARELRAVEDRRLLVRIGVAGAISGNVMMLAFALYGGVVTGIQAEFATLFRWLSALLGLLSLAWPGSVFFRAAWASVRTRTPNLDLPIALGLLAGGLSGLANTVLGSGEIYFDSLTVLVFLLLVGRFIQHRQQRSAGDAVELLFSLTPTSARLITPDGVQTVATASLAVGDAIEVRAGESIPVDGTVLAGTSSIDQAILTGESRPVSVTVGDSVAAGVVNLSAPLRIIATATGKDTGAARLMRLVEEASLRKPAILRFTDSVATRFVVVVSVLAALTLGLWLWLNPARAIDNAAALLIVTCPCALGLAAPLVFAVTIGRGARRGVLIKGADVLERLARPGVLLLDKTGTITSAGLHVQRWIGGERELGLAAALERASSHPVAAAIVEYAARRGQGPPVSPPADSVRQVTGQGISGEVDGVAVAVGSPAYIGTLAGAAPADLARSIEAVVEMGLSPVLVAVEGRTTGLFALGDPIREDAAASMAAFKSRGWRIGVLSGDHPSIVARVAVQLGLDPADCRGGVSPEGKLAAVQRAIAENPDRTIVMVGDGVNDAAALSAASVGIAVHGGAEASLAAADAYLSRPGLAPIAELLSAADGAMRAVRRTLWASLAYNALAAVLAITGLIHPILAAILMPLSSLTVLTIAMRTRAFGGRPWS